MINIPMFSGVVFTSIIATLVGCWNTIKLYIGKVINIFIARSNLYGASTSKAIQYLLRSEYKCSIFEVKNYLSSREFIQPLGKRQLIGYECLQTTPTIWWNKMKPILVTINDEMIKLSVLRFWGINIETFILDAINKYNTFNLNDNNLIDRFIIIKLYGNIGNKEINNKDKSNSGKEPEETTSPSGFSGSRTFDKYAHRSLQWKTEDIGELSKNIVYMDTLSLKDNVLKAVEEALIWKKQEEWFRERLIPWKRGWLLYGPPGTGKTAFVRALGQKLNMPIIVFDLSTMSNRDFSENWTTVTNKTPCIALFEDLDNVFHGRKNIISTGMQQGLSFDCFLNTLDGVDNTDGIFKIITTNNIELIDPALGNSINGDEMSTRPGRIDRIIKFDLLDQNGRIKIAQRIFNGFSEDKWVHLLKEGENDTGAQFQERCCRLAQKLFWGNNK